MFEATDKQETGEIEKIYSLAEWCFRQKANDLRNAAAVAFYEHLVDHPYTAKQVSLWIKPDIFRDLETLFESVWAREVLKFREEYYSQDTSVHKPF